MIDNLTEAIEKYKHFVECETESARVLREHGNVKDAKYFEKTAENDRKIVAWLTELQERREADKWIPVSERLPEDDGQYLVTREEYIPSSSEYRTFDTDGAPHWEIVVDLARFEGNFNRAHNYENHNNGFNKAYKVLAWKPLPKPYESEDK